MRNYSTFNRMLVLLAVALSIPMGLSAQIEMSIAGEPVLLPDDRDATPPRFGQRDDNDDLCALLKVYPTHPMGATLVLNTGGSILPIPPDASKGWTSKQSDGVWWFWISPKTRNIQFTAEGYTETAWISYPFQEGKVYKISLNVGAAGRIVYDVTLQETAMKLHIVPQQCVVSYGKDKTCSMGRKNITNGYFEELLNNGTYYYKVENEYYETLTGSCVLTGGTHEQSLVLKPAFGLLHINSEPAGADVYLDGSTQSAGKTPLTTPMLKKGRHSIQLSKDEYYTSYKEFDVAPTGEVQAVPDVVLKSQMGTAVCLCLDPEADLTVTDATGQIVAKGKNGLRVSLNSKRIYKLTASRPSHSSQNARIPGGEILEGKEISVTVDAPVPLYGILQVSSEPPLASLFIDNEYIGTTSWIGKLLVGEHKVELRLDNYTTDSFTVLVEENQKTAVDRTLQKIPDALDLGLSVKWASRPLDSSYRGEGVWRHPTRSECDELIAGCIWRTDVQGGRTGLTGESRRNGRTIFIPAAGYATPDRSRLTQWFVVDAKREAALLQAEKKEQEKQAREEKKRQRQDKEAAYNEKYHNKGLSHSLEISYFSYSNTGEVVYRHSGYREYGSLYPVEVDYTLSYKFGRAFSLGAGAGFFYNTKSLTIQGDDFAPMYGGSFKEKRWDIPIYANARLYLLRTAVRPVLSVSGGVYLMTGTLLLDYGGGLEVRIARRFSMTAALSGRTVPRPVFVNSEVGASASYKPCHALSVRLILSF